MSIRELKGGIKKAHLNTTNQQQQEESMIYTIVIHYNSSGFLINSDEPKVFSTTDFEKCRQKLSEFKNKYWNGVTCKRENSDLKKAKSGRELQYILMHMRNSLGSYDDNIILHISESE